MERRQQIMNKRTLWITRTAVLTAMLVVLQATTQATGNTVITGSVVNMLLIISVMACGILSGITVAVISPVMAKLIGIGPLWSLIPFYHGRKYHPLYWFGTLRKLEMGTQIRRKHRSFNRCRLR